MRGGWCNRIDSGAGYPYDANGHENTNVDVHKRGEELWKRAV